jgi:hypothetical protein
MVNQKVTRPPAASETRWAGILPQIAWVNEHCDVLDLYEKKPAKNCALSDDGTTFKDHLLTEYDHIIIAELDVALRPVGPFISTLEATERVTSSLVLPMTHGILHATSKDVPVVKYMYINGELMQEDIVKHEDLSSEVNEVRTILYNENNSRFKEKESEGHVEDLLIATILDPRFKLMNFIGCTSSTKHDAENYLRSAYKADWSPEAIAFALKKVADANKDPNDEDDDDCEEEPLPEPEPEPIASIFQKKVS